MAARRLIALLVVLLVISSIAAALAPTPAERDGESSSTATTTTGADEPGKAGSGGARLIEATAEVPPPRGETKGGKQAEPAKIDATVGDQLALIVRAEETIAVEIPELGLLETAVPGGPARFDVLLREPGRLAVLAEGGRQVAWVNVAAPEPPAADDGDRKKQPEDGQQPQAEPESGTPS